MIWIEKFQGVTGIKMARMILGKPFYFTSCYFVDSLLIDTGCVRAKNEVMPFFKDLNIDLIVNTHCHEDHIGLNSEFSCKILASKLAIPFINEPRKLEMKFYRRFAWGVPKPSYPEEIGKRVETENFKFEVISTPGHSEGHICLYENEKKWIFTGDLYIGGKDRVLRKDFDIWKIIDSLKKINSLNIEVMFSGSGKIYKNPNLKISEKISYLENLGKKIFEMYDEGKTESQISRKLFGREGWFYYLSEGEFSSENLVKSFLKKKLYKL